MRILGIVLLVVLVVVGLQWGLEQRSVAGVEHDFKADVKGAVRDARDAVANIDVDQVKDDLARTGRVVRLKVADAGQAVGEATEDARTTASIKAKYALDPDLSAIEISVDTTDGRVTLAGRAGSPELVARAMGIALAEDGVREGGVDPASARHEFRGDGHEEPLKPGPTTEAARAAGGSRPRSTFPDAKRRACQSVEDYFATPRLTAILLAIFAALALLVSMAGLGGVLGTSVSERTQEFGLRMALGAPRHRVLGMVVRQGLSLVMVGLLASYAFTRPLSAYLFDTQVTDPSAVASVLLTFVIAALLALLGPALRATRVDPLVALRTE